MKVIDIGGGIGTEKHAKLQKHMDQIILGKSEIVVKRFEARLYAQELLYIYRNHNDLYTVVSSEVYYTEFLNYLDWESGKVQLEEGQSEIDFESDLKIVHLPIDVIGVLSEDAVGWLGEIVKKLRFDAGPLPDEDWPSFHFEEN